MDTLLGIILLLGSFIAGAEWKERRITRAARDGRSLPPPPTPR